MDVSNAIVRRAVAADLDALLALRVVMFTDTGAPGAADPAWREVARDWFAAHLDDPRVCMVVVELDGAVASAAVGQRSDGIPSPSGDGRGVHLSNVATLPEARRRGLARLAVEGVLAWADGEGLSRVDLFASEDGRPLYESLGFAERGAPAMRRLRPAD